MADPITIGLAAANVIPAIAGLFRSKKPKATPSPYDDILKGHLGNIRFDPNRNPLNTGLYKAGYGRVGEIVRGLGRRDTQRASALGNQGSEFEIAQGANRLKFLADAERGLVQDATRQKTIEDGQAMAQIMAVLAALEDNRRYGQGRRDRKDSQRSQAAGAGLNALVQALFAANGAGERPTANAA